jgi:hypothetical protein
LQVRAAEVPDIQISSKSIRVDDYLIVLTLDVDQYMTVIIHGTVEVDVVNKTNEIVPAFVLDIYLDVQASVSVYMNKLNHLQ